MMVLSDGYAILYEKQKNMVIIDLPPTAETVRDTVSQIVRRKTDLTTSDLELLLMMTKYVCKGGDE